jgi:membrane-associated phospholipid phosphatase
MEYWFIILGILNLALFFGGLIVLIPKKTWKTTWSEQQKNLIDVYPYLIIIGGVVALHLIEVNLLDPVITKTIGMNFTTVFQSIEGGVVFWFSQHQIPILNYFFVFIYIVLYPFTLWFSLLYFITTGQRQALKTFAYGLILLYAVALPFYLLLPITNVYTTYGTLSPLNTVIPGVDHFFYTTTTANNCFPSLHVAITLLVAYTVALTKNKRFTTLVTFTAVCVILSVIYLAIHWITDVIGGMLLAFGVFYIIKHWKKEN